MNYKLINNNNRVKVGTNYKLKLVSDRFIEVEKVEVSCGCMSSSYNPTTGVIAINISVGAFPRHLSGTSYKSSKSVTIKFKSGTSEKHKINYEVLRT